MRRVIKAILILLFIFYLILLTQKILFKYPLESVLSGGHENILWTSNFIPFKTIIEYLFLSDLSLTIRLQNLLGNLIGFIPLGLFLPLLSSKFRHFKRMMLIAVLLSLTYELLQLLFGMGSFDIDDLILNTLGGTIGYILSKGLIIIFLKKEQSLAG